MRGHPGTRFALRDRDFRIRHHRGDLAALGKGERIVVTAGVHDTVNRARVGECLAMHSRGDWGCIGDDDKRCNDRALASGDERMLSAYPIDPARSYDDGGDNRLWVVTEWDRSVTTVLLPSEY